MAKAAITKRTVDAAKPSTSDQFIWDTDVSGFGLKVTPAGGKVYVFQYRIARPGQADRTPAKRYTIGKHGRLTPDQARKRAKELAALVEQGIDPRQRDIDEQNARDEAERQRAEKARLENELLFEKVADLWLDHYENEKDRRPSSVRMAKGVVENHLKPRLTGTPIPHIRRADLQQIIDAIPSKRKATRRSVYAYASVLFGWAHKRGDISENPVVSIEKPEGPAARHRVLSDVELTSIWRASGVLGDPFGPFFRLLILTGQRRSEVAGLMWEELDRGTSAWTIPARRAKNGVSHLVPLALPVVAELDRLAQGEQWPRSGHVLTTTGRTPISGVSKATKTLNATVTKELDGEPLPKWRIHDLRRTLATGLQRLGIRFEVTEAVLNHISGAKGGIAGIYQRHDWKEEKRSALQAWANHVISLIQPTEQQNVVPLKGTQGGARSH